MKADARWIAGARLAGAVLGIGMILGGACRTGWAAETVRVSVDSAGIEASDFSSFPAIDLSGRYVGFDSRAGNLVATDGNAQSDVFVYDRKTALTTRVSVASDGTEGDGASVLPSFGKGGRFVSFESSATNLVAGDTNGMRDVFVHDRKRGNTTRVSVDSAGAEADGTSGFASLSSSGRFVAFTSTATNLVAGDTNGAYDVFVHDRKTGETSRVSVNRAAGQANGHSLTAGGASLGKNGRIIPFQSEATNLVAGDINGTVDAFVHDRKTHLTTRVSVDSSGAEANGPSGETSVSANGRLVVFTSGATNLVAGDTNGVTDVFVHDLKTGATTRVSVDSSGGQANGRSGAPAISGNGRLVTFVSDASNLVSGDTNLLRDVFVHDLVTGVTERVSVSTAGSEANGASLFATLNRNGRFVALVSDASNLVTADVNGESDVFVRDRKP